MLCKSFDKEIPCVTRATVEVFWPGKTTVACDRHHEGMKRIASAMGFTLDARPIPADPEDSGKGAPEDYPQVRDKGM